MYGLLVNRLYFNMNENQENLFDEYAYDWWNKTGYYKLLHKLNPVRLQYIQSKFNLKGKKVLDIGCGGGLLTEELCKAGALVTGIDSSAKSIKIAQQHAKEHNYEINYINKSIFESSFSKKFDCIICFEMIEHINSPNLLLKKILEISKDNSSLFLSTLNRNLKSFIFAKLVAEYVLKYVPKGTHQYSKFITPYELTKMIEGNKFALNSLDGIKFNPLEESFLLSNNIDINYFLYAKRK
tara:strand:+ start:15319 stop:16035 length:717 start_codon:yes stop_codon:yes gene_type:complete